MEPDPTATGPAHPVPIRVTVVEDDDSIRESITNWIRRSEGFACVGQFPDGESAVARMVDCAPHIALVDINLPGLSGIECVRRLKPRLPDSQFVMLTVYEDSEHIFNGLAAGATGYLLKRTNREALITALREAHAGGAPMTSSIARKVVQSLHRAEPKMNPADKLSKRENEVLRLLAQGYLYKEIADTMGIAVPTVNSFICRIYEKLHVHSRAQALALLAETVPVYTNPVGRKE